MMSNIKIILYLILLIDLYITYALLMGAKQQIDIKNVLIQLIG
jgi:hypothetical protein